MLRILGFILFWFCFLFKIPWGKCLRNGVACRLKPNTIEGAVGVKCDLDAGHKHCMDLN